MKLVGGDNGRVEQEEFVENILLSPSERVIVDVLFEQAGMFPIEHHTPEKTYRLGAAAVAAQPAAPSFAAAFSSLRRSQELGDLRREIAGDFDREPDKTIALLGEMPGMKPMPTMKHSGGQLPVEAIEWEDDSAQHGGMSHAGNMFWKIVDRATGKVNHEIDWVFESGPRVKIRIENPTESDHPMQHPMHFHGQRFLVLRRDGRLNDNLVWKDTVLVKTGEVVDILLDTSNPGAWMAHCHISEHVEIGMMFNFVVKGEVSETDLPLPATVMARDTGPISFDERHAQREVAAELRENEFRLRDVGPGQTTLVRVNGEDVAVYNVAGAYYATQDECTHARGPLNKGKLEGECIVCPWHGSRFDVRDGTVLDGPAREPLKTYRVIVEGETGRVA
jgi:nitrite reductase/ring-hydroxylating ferredoxin subunit